MIGNQIHQQTGISHSCCVQHTDGRLETPEKQCCVGQIGTVTRYHCNPFAE